MTILVIPRIYSKEDWEKHVALTPLSEIRVEKKIGTKLKRQIKYYIR
jgi:hypothetical protein